MNEIGRTRGFEANLTIIGLTIHHEKATTFKRHWTMSTPPGYEQKLADFIKLCAYTKAKGIREIVVGYPWVLGDDYEELIESLSRLEDAGLSLHVGVRKEWPSRN